MNAYTPSSRFSHNLERRGGDTVSDPILTPGQYDEAMRLAVNRGPGSGYADRDLRAHDAALRSRLAEAEADLDRWQRIAASEGQAHTEAEAALAEAVKLLRQIDDAGELLDGGWAESEARAFIEAHGSSV